MHSLTIYTDGACPHNPGGVGGWGVFMTRGPGIERAISGFVQKPTTNNRTELIAVIEALKRLPLKAEATVFTDSEYIVKGINQWVKKWKANGWSRRKKPSKAGQAKVYGENKDIKNLDLWQELDSLSSQRPLVRIAWVRGHSGNHGNDIADRLAVEATTFKHNNVVEVGTDLDVLIQGTGSGSFRQAARPEIKKHIGLRVSS